MKSVHVILIALLSVVDARAYTLKLDFDTDNDPSTINPVAAAYSAEVSIHIWPTTANEIVPEVSFDMGGSCSQCGAWNTYRQAIQADIVGSGCRATGTDFLNICQSWSNLTPTCDQATGIALPFGVGTTANTNVMLNGPLTLVRFNAGIGSLEGPFCPEGPRRLCLMTPSGELSCVEFDYRSMPVEPTAWGRVKATYR